jgi:hypothetical protein
MSGAITPLPPYAFKRRDNFTFTLPCSLVFLERRSDVSFGTENFSVSLKALEIHYSPSYPRF